MSRSVLWEANIDGWENISVESYQFVIEQAKERLEEEINETQAIVSWAMKILFSYVAALSALAGYVFTQHNTPTQGYFTFFLVSIVVIFSIYVFTLLFAIISKRPKYYKGSAPEEIFYSELFRNKTPVVGYKLLLANEIERIDDKIQRIGSINKKRRSQYRSILKISLIIVALFIFAVFKKFFTTNT
jgi:hypothetical protein